MKQEEIDLINTLWEMFEDLEPDISTERLFAMVQDEASRQLGRDIDAGDISEAMAPQDRTKGAK